MSHEKSEELRLIAALWQDRYGEPLPIITDVDLMLQVLHSASAEAPQDRRPVRGRFNYL